MSHRESLTCTQGTLTKRCHHGEPPAPLLDTGLAAPPKVRFRANNPLLGGRQSLEHTPSTRMVHRAESHATHSHRHETAQMSMNRGWTQLGHTCSERPQPGQERGDGCSTDVPEDLVLSASQAHKAQWPGRPGQARPETDVDPWVQGGEGQGLLLLLRLSLMRLTKSGDHAS